MCRVSGNAEFWIAAYRFLSASELNNAAPWAGSGLYLEQAKAANKKTFAGSGKGLARNVGFVAGTTGDFSRLDGRAVVAMWLPKLLPFGGAPGFHRDTQFVYSRVGHAHQGFLVPALHYES